MGFLKRARQKKEITREQAAQDLEVSYKFNSGLWPTSCHNLIDFHPQELERRREELEQLLVAARV